VTVKVLAGPVIAHCRARVGVAGGDLDIAQVHPGVDHGRNEGVPKHVRMRSGDLYASSLGESAQAACRRVSVHPGAAAVEQDRSASPGAYRLVDSAPDGWRQRGQDDLGAFAAYAQHPVAMLFTQVGDVRSGRLEDPQAQEAEHGYEREVAVDRGLAGRGDQGLELEVGEPEGG
jgi:hypothetical protein